MSAPVLVDCAVDFERRQVASLVAEAAEALDAFGAGDLDALFAAHLAVARAVGLMVRHRLGWCGRCGSTVSLQHGSWHCGGCGVAS